MAQTNIEAKMPNEAETAEVLGIAAPLGQAGSLLWIAHVVADGLPLSSLERLVSQVAPDDKSFVYRMIPRPTLARRRKASALASTSRQALLSPDEGAKVARLAEVWAMACDVWGGEDAARAFLFRPHPMLESQRPIDVVLATEFGRPLIEGILGRLQYGSAA
jgi:putative toxin-antitoxin system antitoxin component (TIGR02293 family)